MLENIHDYGSKVHSKWTIDEYDRAATIAENKRKSDDETEIELENSDTDDTVSDSDTEADPESEDDDEPHPLADPHHDVPLHTGHVDPIPMLNGDTDHVLLTTQ